ncbi:LPS biosynthesis protein WbpP [Salipaludibacillus keqinensis]|uniref:LPS biosynthesis protein WbpP n=1 Tax=Salipaludibacillus keqinensis TaxID=2045207 RepID=A0A323TCP8_9BACI|nr:SDR family oxidoreductase [Salipaludibacillus keqinensis]PYZ92580.1 LPS biosynthesis protein WbpP [Salipaludibacillus keqinensis]
MGYENVRFSEGATFLVTGAAGFIGSNLVEAILKLGYQVKGIDNYSTGKKGNVEIFIGNQNYTFIEGDITNLDTCINACEGVDYVLHQAAWGSVPRSIEMPLFYEEVNIKGTLNMMESARQNDVKKFVYASSSSVYGDEPKLPKQEGREGNVLSPYALTKKVDEEYGRLYTKLYGLDTYGLRYFNVFGRRQDPHGAYAAVIPKFIKQLLANEQPTINGDGKQSRDFTYIENVIEANLKACQSSHEAAGQTYNVAFGGREYLIDIYDGLCKALEKDVKPIFGPERAGDIKHSNADISKAKEMLGYDPEWSFEKGIEEAIDWYKSLVNETNNTMGVVKYPGIK